VAELRMTPARVALLRAVADPNVEVSATVGLGGTWSTADVYLRRWGQYERKVTAAVALLEAAGLIVRGGVGEHFYAARPYSLTPDGEKALARIDALGATKEASR
jgi:hypothetical protein